MMRLTTTLLLLAVGLSFGCAQRDEWRTGHGLVGFSLAADTEAIAASIGFRPEEPVPASAAA